MDHLMWFNSLCCQKILLAPNRESSVEMPSLTFIDLEDAVTRTPLDGMEPSPER